MDVICVVNCSLPGPHTDLRKLLGDVPPYKHGLQVDPQVLHRQPLLDDLCGVGQLLDPQLDGRLEGNVVPEEQKGGHTH